ncbi:extensin family protein [Bradyrhizobium sp.]|uniref:extensin family protein n=1 Tax=Bradyrhizobium sp. TaxID=376 RepID=UPI00403811FB
MDFSAEKSSRKLAGGALDGRAAAMVTAAVLALAVATGPAAGRESARETKPVPPLDLFAGKPKLRGTIHRPGVPLPRPRPAEAPKNDSKSESKAAPDKAEPPGEPAKPAEPPPPSACRLALTEEIAIAPSIPDIKGPGGCGGEDLVRLEAVVLPDKRKVPVKPAAILRCRMASAIADWIRSDMAPIAARLGSQISELDNFDSYECRGRNRVAGAQLSEHGRANALDVRAVKLVGGKSIQFTDRTVPRELRESVLHSVCARFATVLGPGSDWYHEDHIHLDVAERRNNYRICQWNVWDPLPQVAPLLPAERPPEAPPREVAAKSDEPAKPEAAKSDREAPEAEPAPAKQKATKKRR